MLALAFHKLARAVVAVWRDPETKALPIVAGALLFSGTLFYWRVEGWTIIESLYFSVVTLTTVGFGDLTPTTPGAQIFTIFYILTGIGVFVALLASVAQQYIDQKTESPSARERLSARRPRRHGWVIGHPGLVLHFRSTPQRSAQRLGNQWPDLGFEQPRQTLGLLVLSVERHRDRGPPHLLPQTQTLRAEYRQGPTPSRRAARSQKLRRSPLA